MNKFQELKKELPGVRKSVSLKKYTTFEIGGLAKYFFVAHTSEEIEKAVKVASVAKIPFVLLSGGSNVLFSDSGFPGLVIKIQNTQYTIHNTNAWAESGVELGMLVKKTGALGLSGLEWAGGLPGTLGGAIRGNAGAFGGEIKDCVVSVVALDAEGKRKTFSKKQCQFAYRFSMFKEKNYTILSAVMKLKKGNKKTIQDVAEDHIQYRKEKHPMEYPNAGSIFKNCDLKKIPKKLHKEFESVIKIDPFPVVPTACLIAQAGLQGMRVGEAEVSKKHPNYIVNRGHATARDVLALIEVVEEEVKKKFSIELDVEIQLL